MNIFEYEFGLKYLLTTNKQIINKLVNPEIKTLFVTPNTHHIIRILKDNYLHDIYTNSTICVNDSRVLRLLVKLIKNKNIGLNCGSDVTKTLLSNISKLDYTVDIVGLSHIHFRKLRSDLFKNSRCKLTHSFIPFDINENQHKLKNYVPKLISKQADFYFIVIGSPQQEILGNLLFEKLEKNSSILCVGSSLDYLIGKEKRAPYFIQKINLEWLYRFIFNPRKHFRRYFIECPLIFKFLFTKYK